MARTQKEETRISRLSSVGYVCIKIAESTVKFEGVNHPDLNSMIYAVWHGWQLGLASVRSRKDTYLLISPSNDGELIARISSKLGFSNIRGSMKRGGTKALREILKTLKEDKCVAYTVDGPRGPIFKVKSGIIKIAQLSQKPIVPLVPASKRKLVANSWDKYMVPVFSKQVTVFGEPIYVPADLDDEGVEYYRQMLENKLFELREQAEDLVK